MGSANVDELKREECACGAKRVTRKDGTVEMVKDFKPIHPI
jgi:hypothetical protein